MTSSNQSITKARLNKNIEAAIYILGWYFFSLAISVYNKWMFGNGLKFRFPILITSFHQFCLMNLSCLVLYLKPKLRPSINNGGGNGGYTYNSKSLVELLRACRIDYLSYVRQILPCSLASAGDIGLSNVSFKFISLSLYTMLKSSSLMFVLLFGLLFKLERYNWRILLIVIIMTVSVLMMVKKPDLEDSSLDNEHNGAGILLVIAASMMSGLRWSFTQILLKHNDYTNNSISTIFYLSPSMCAILFVLGLIFEGWGNFVSSPIWEYHGVLKTIFLMIVPGVLAFMMTLCEFKLLSVAQLITLSIAGIFKELLTIILSLIIFGDRLSLVNYLGLFLTFIDILWYNYYRYYENSNDNGYLRTKSDDEEVSIDIELRNK